MTGGPSSFGVSGGQAGNREVVLLAFLSARIRRWFLLVVVVPLFGRVLEAVGVRLGERRGASLLRSTGGRLRGPQTDPSRRRRR